MAREIHFAEVTRNTDEEEAEGLRGAIFFQSDTLTGGVEYPVPAEPMFPLATGAGGFFFVPRPGDIVEIEIDDALETPEPHWRCGVYSAVDEIDPEFKINYPNRMGWATHSGHIILFDDTEGEEYVKIAHTLTTQLEFDAFGSWIERIRKDRETDIVGDRKMVVRKDWEDEIAGNKFVNIAKDEIYDVGGTVERFVGGDLNEDVSQTHNYKAGVLSQEIGVLEQTVTGSKQVNCDGGHKLNCGGSSTENILSNFTRTVGGTSSDLISAAEDRTIGLGSKETIATIGKSFEILLGQFDVNVLAGMLSLIVQAGQAKFGNALGTITVDPAGGITLASLLATLTLPVTGMAQLQGTPLTLLGAGTSPVLSVLTDPVVDTITGAPHIGVPTVLVG